MSDAAIALSFVMPAYNEEGALPGTVAACTDAIAALGMRCEIVIANDGSTDGTRRVLDDLAGRTPALRVVHREKNGGYGAALSDAIDAARGELLVPLDSDGQFDPHDAAKLLGKRAEGYDVVLGYRARKADKATKVFLDRVLRVIVRVLFGVGFTDTNCAIRLVPRSALAQITLEARGFANPTEMVLKLHARGLKIGEVAVTHRERAAGASALRSMRTSVHMLAFLVYLRLKLALFRRGIIQAP
ncbi:MAG: glycosyltransferase family 2 protein [Acidobacteriota bacterium]